MDIRHLIITGAVVLLAHSICKSYALRTFDNKTPIIKTNVVRMPVSLPVYMGQQPVSTGSVYPYYNYYPQSQYPNTGVVYQPIGNGVQYPYYDWSNTPAKKPSVPTTSTGTLGGNAGGDSSNPKSDVEYI